MVKDIRIRKNLIDYVISILIYSKNIDLFTTEVE